MAGNNSPIFSRVGDIQGGALLTTGAGDYVGTSTTAVLAFTADTANGGFIQRLRFKANTGTNVATVARVFINNGNLNLISQVSSSTFTAPTTSTTGGSLLTQTYYAKVQAYDQYNGWSLQSVETSTYVAGATGSITWNWTAAAGASGYRLFVGPQAGGEYAYFNTTTNYFTQTVAVIAGQVAPPIENVTNNIFYGEISLPATAISTTAATVEIDYPMNIAMPPGYRVFVGLGATVAGGWYVSAIGGKY